MISVKQTLTILKGETTMDDKIPEEIRERMELIREAGRLSEDIRRGYEALDEIEKETVSLEKSKLDTQSRISRNEEKFNSLFNNNFNKKENHQ
jgi:predicted nuclease with TOPRIM domain